MKCTPFSAYIIMIMIPAVWGAPAMAGEDCNGNGLPDNLDIAPTPSYGSSSFPTNEFPISLTTHVVGLDGAAAGPFDADGDGHADVAVVNHVPGGLTIQLGDGAGNLTISSFIPLEGFDAGLRVQAADLNGDGHPDLVLVAGSLHILINDGSGQFAIEASYDPLWAIALADLDGDLDIDIAGRANVNGQPVLIVLRNDGNASFVADDPIPLQVFANSVVAADFDNDQNVDLAVDAGSNVRVLLNDGSGGFPFFGDFPASTTLNSIIAADLDGNGTVDLAGAGGFRLSIMLNLGAATFDAATTYTFQSEFDWLIAYDADGDGDLDLGTIGNSNTFGSRFTSIRNAGEANFAGPTYVDTGNVDISPALDFADFNEDGAIDVAAVYLDGGFPGVTVFVLLNDPIPPIAFDCNDNGIIDECDLSHRLAFEPRETFPTDNQPVAVLSTARLADGSEIPLDLNGDGEVDLVTANENGNSMSALLNNGRDGGGVWLGYALPANFDVQEAPVALAAADFDDDGNIDVATAGIAGGGMNVYFNDGNGSFPDIDAYDEGAKTGIAAADVDGDGDIDLIGGTDIDGEILVSLNQGDGVFDPPAAYDVGENTMRGLAVADIDLDGSIDVVTANNQFGSISILYNDGDGTYDGTAPTVIDVGGEPFHVAVVDLNGDDHPDIAIADQAGPGLTVLLNNRDGTFGEPVKYWLSLPQPPIFFSTQTRFVAAADLDGDDDLDLVLSNRSHDNVTVLLNRGDGTFLPVMVFDTGDSPGGLTLADVDGDGNIDMATADQFDDTVSVHLFSGLTEPVSRDVDGNGIPDECECDPCDMNCDGDINAFDIEPFLDLLFGGGDPCNTCTGDVNGDGGIDAFDIEPFLECLFP